MLWYLLAQLYSTLLELIRLARISTDEEDLETLILRQQLDVLVRKNAQVISPGRLERWSLAVLAAALKERGRLTARQLGNVIRIVKPETVINWHRRHVQPGHCRDHALLLHAKYLSHYSSATAGMTSLAKVSRGVML